MIMTLLMILLLPCWCEGGGFYLHQHLSHGQTITQLQSCGGLQTLWSVVNITKIFPPYLGLEREGAEPAQQTRELIVFHCSDTKHSNY